jgi:hypothetical protein
MGFGAGFGEAFSRSFEQQRQRSHERETDEFRYRMETFTKNKEKYDTYKTEDARHASLAKKLVELTGQPPEAVGAVYGMLKDGMDENTALAVLQKKKFKADPASADQQTEAALAPPEDTTAPAPAAPAPGLDGGGFLSKIFPGMKKFKGSGVEQRVQDTTGMTPEEIAQIDQGYTPEGMPETPGQWTDTSSTETNDVVEAKKLFDQANYALKQNPGDPDLKAGYDAAKRQYESIVAGTQVKANAGGFGQAPSTIGTMEIVVTNPDGTKSPAVGQMTAEGTFMVDGQPVEARAKSDDEKERGQKIIEKLGEPALEYNDKVQNLSQAYTAFGNAKRIIDENPEVLQERTAGLDQYFVDLGKDVQAGMKLVNETLANPENGDPGQLEKVEKDLEAASQDVNLGPMQKLAAAKGLLNVQYAIAAYHVAAAKGQKDKGLSETERKMFQELPNSATSPEQWIQTIGSVLVPEKQALAKQAELLPQSNLDYKRFIEDYGYSPVGDLNPIESYLEGTPGADLDRTLPQSGFQAVVTPEESKTPAPETSAPAEYPGYKYTGKKTPQGVPLYEDENGNIGTME